MADDGARKARGHERNHCLFSRAEQDLLIGWQDPPAWDRAAGQEAEPPGRGKFLVKVGGRLGIPIDVQLTDVETTVHDTNKLWHTVSRIGARPGELVGAEQGGLA